MAVYWQKLYINVQRGMNELNDTILKDGDPRHQGNNSIPVFCLMPERKPRN